MKSWTLSGIVFSAGCCAPPPQRATLRVGDPGSAGADSIAAAVKANQIFFRATIRLSPRFLLTTANPSSDTDRPAPRASSGVRLLYFGPDGGYGGRGMTSTRRRGDTDFKTNKVRASVPPC